MEAYSVLKTVSSSLSEKLLRLALKLSNFSLTGGIWIDVGAHLGEVTFPYALRSPSLTVYAFEPNLEVASKLMGMLRNFVVIPMAVAEEDGFAEFYINNDPATSSLLTLNEAGSSYWKAPETLVTVSKRPVATIRLDTFLHLMNITKVDYLKIDAQGSDLSIVKSLGEEIHKVKKLTLEVQTTQVPLYDGSNAKDSVIGYLSRRGFEMIAATPQSLGQEENLTFIRMDQAYQSENR